MEKMEKKPLKMKREMKRHYSLLELLVVIGIIVPLTVILFLLMTKERAHVRQPPPAERGHSDSRSR